ncbi:MAG: nitroreductase family protein [Bryobacterales bacterium]
MIDAAPRLRTPASRRATPTRPGILRIHEQPPLRARLLSRTRTLRAHRDRHPHRRRRSSGANKQPWHFCVVQDPVLKRRIREAAEAEERENYERRFLQEWLDDLAPFETTWQKPFLEVAPYLIVVFRLDYALGADGEKSKHYYVQESVGIAAGFLLAALHQAGLATLTHTPSPMGFLAEILDRPKNERAFLLIPVGYPADGARVPTLEKKSVDQILTRY